MLEDFKKTINKYTVTVSLLMELNICALEKDIDLYIVKKTLAGCCFLLLIVILIFIHI